MSTTATAGLVVVCVTIAAGCRSPRYDHESRTREIVQEEVPRIVDEQVGKITVKWLPWAIGATGLGGGGLWAAIKKQVKGKAA